MTRSFAHSDGIWRDFPGLVAGVLLLEEVTAGMSFGPQVAALSAVAESRLSTASEGELREVQAWRRAFSQMGLKPTQYRCASESLLRRYRKEGTLPRLHPLVDLCNAASLAYAIPVAAFDIHRIEGNLLVRYAGGDETYLSFSGQLEHPAPGEVIFADDAGNAHARRWTNRQGRASAVRDTTTTALIIAEGLHDTAPADVPALQAELVSVFGTACSAPPAAAMLSQAAPDFTFTCSPERIR